MGKMLVTADINDTCVATPRGLQLAHKLGHAVEVIAFTHAPMRGMKITASEQKAIKVKLMAAREKAVQARIDKFAKPEQKVSLKVIWEKDLNHWVLKYRAKGWDMVVKTGQRKAATRLTSVDWQLIRECTAPVLIVAEKKWHRTRPILAAIDLGTTVKEKKLLNQQIIVTAKALAQALDAELKLISVITIPTLLTDLDLIDPIAYVRQEKESMAPALKKLAVANDLPATAFKIKRGPVDKVITSYAAKHRAQLVVMGTVGRSGVRARLLGNTAEAVLQHLKTDVLALKLEK
jgi:universal stress protein E